MQPAKKQSTCSATKLNLPYGPGTVHLPKSNFVAVAWSMAREKISNVDKQTNQHAGWQNDITWPA